MGYELREKTFHKLLEGIRRYGLENVSTLSKWIDIPVETARYMIWEELPKHNISVGISVNLPRIGLGSWMLQLEPTEKTHANAIEEYLKDNAGMMFIARVIPTNAIYGVAGIPFGEQFKLREQLEHLKSNRAINSFSMDEIEWTRHISFNPLFYDFNEKKWSFDWKQVEEYREPLLTPYSKEDQLPLVDHKDLLILKELQLRVPRTLSKLSDSLDMDQHNIRYHSKNHARQAIQGYFMKLVPKDSGDFHSSIVFFYEHTSEKTLAEARSIALTLPFSTKVWKTDKEYCWYVSCPGEYTSSVLRYLNYRFASIPGTLRYSILDPKSEFNGIIPYHLFDENSGAWKYEPKNSLQILRK